MLWSVVSVFPSGTHVCLWSRASWSPHATVVTDSISGTQIRLLVSVPTPSSVWENEEDEGENGSADWRHGLFVKPLCGWAAVEMVKDFIASSFPRCFNVCWDEKQCPLMTCSYLSLGTKAVITTASNIVDWPDSWQTRGKPRGQKICSSTAQRQDCVEIWWRLQPEIKNIISIVATPLMLCCYLRIAEP